MSRIAQVVEALAVGVVVVEGQVVVHANPAATALLGADCAGRTLASLFTADSADTVARYLTSTAASPGHGMTHRATVLHPDGALVHLDVAARVLDGTPPLPGHQAFAVSLVDVTAMVLERDRLRHAGSRDETTGVLSGAAFREFLLDEWRQGEGGSMLLVAVENLRVVADVYGDAACDDVLRTLAGRFGVHVDPVGKLGRLRSEQFGVLLPRMSAGRAQQFADRLCQEARKPVAIANGEPGVAVSIGIVDFPEAGPTDTGVRDLLRRGDLALLMAQSDGGDRVAVYRPDLSGLGERLKTLSTEALDLRREKNLAEELALTDALTRLPNRLALDRKLAALPGQAQRSGAAVSVVFVDIDLFGKYNHAHGDAAGDDTLRAVAEVLAGGVRNQDQAFRKGGEEFVCLLFDADLDEATAVAERLRSSVENAALPHHDSPFPVVTITAGVATWTDGGGRSLGRTVDAAAHAAFRGKETGARNQVHRDGAL